MTAVVHAPAQAAGGPNPRFLALQYRDCRWYLGGAMLSMMADNVEHVISYWVLFQTFHSPALAGFAVISHWVPFLLFSVYFGSLADRFDCRKVVQVSQLLFMGVSAIWGFLFVTHQLEVWHAMALLVLHGIAAALWSPAEQLILYDIVGPEALPSAVRLNVTARNLGMLCGPAVGSALLVTLGEDYAILANVLIYLPLTIWLARVPYTGHLREEPGTKRVRLTPMGALRVLRDVADNPVIVSMVVLAGLGAIFLGAALGPLMPEFAHNVGVDQAGVMYGLMMAATALGAVIGGIVLESTGIVKPTAATAIWATVAWGILMVGFALTQNYAVAVVLLVAAGAAGLAHLSISQALVQLLAKPEERGRVLGVYNMAAAGLKAGSGITVGLLGTFIGVQWSLAAASLALALLALGVLAYLRRARPVPLPQTSA